MKIKVNDIVEVLKGEDRGQRGKVLSVNHCEGRLVVESVNRVYKHVRRSQKNPQGGRLNKEMPVQVANVMLVCSKCGQKSRVGARFLDDGSKERYCRKCSGSLGQISPARKAHAKN